MSTAGGTPTDEERLRLARRILLSSPPGQFDLILSDLRKITDLQDDWATEVRAAFEKQTGAEVLNGNASSAEGGGERCEALRERMAEYMEAHYSSEGVSSSCRVSSKASSDDLTVRTYAERVNLKNWYAGSWAGEYSIQVVSSTQATLRGKVSLRAHAFEGGNAQLTSTRDFGPVTVSADKGTWVDPVVAQVGQWESVDVHRSLSEMYDSMGAYIKSFRRAMPITRTRMDWNVSGHRLVKTLNDTKQGNTIGK